MKKPGQPPDDASSAPESGTVRDDTSGSKPSDRGNNPAGAGSQVSQDKIQQQQDDPSAAPEER